MKLETCLEAPDAVEAHREVLGMGRMTSIQGRPGQVVRVHRGVVWLTQEGDAHDHVLGACDEFALDRAGLVVIQALRGADVSVR